MVKPTAVSIRADRAYIKAFRELAERKGKPMADLTREAIDAMFGEDIEPLLSFFGTGDYKNSQSTNELDNSVEEITLP